MKNQLIFSLKDIPLSEMRRLTRDGVLSDGTHNGKIQTYKRLVTMLSSYKLVDAEELE